MAPVMPDNGIDPVDVVMKAAVLLHENSQSTSMTLTAVERLNRGLSVDTTLIPSWASLLLVRRGGVPGVLVAAASPSAVNMRRVASAMRVVDRAEDGPMDTDVTNLDLDAAGAEPISNSLLFAAACATGAGALDRAHQASEGRPGRRRTGRVAATPRTGGR